jgi:perosamine synthetase
MIPVNTPKMWGNEKKYLEECIDSGWISSEGPFVKEFENQFSLYIGKEFGVAVANGSAALDIAVKAIGIGLGDEVIMPTFTIISPALSVIRAGGKPVLVDSDPQTWNMDVEKIEKKITKKTKAILVVHIYGLPVDMEPILQLAKTYNLRIIEDAAEMHGQTYKGRKCGSFGDLSIFSFYPNKLITTGEGGMIVTDDEELAQKCQELRNLSFVPPRRFIHEDFGWNYRMTNMQAALGVAQLEHIEEAIERKRTIGRKYQCLLKDLPYLQLPLDVTSYADNIYWVFGLVGHELSKHDYEYMSEKLKEKGIGTRPFFWCMHKQPVFNKMGLFINEEYPIAEWLADYGFYIPSGLGLKDDEIELVADTLWRICSE